MNYILPKLPYAYEALEPYFDKETMQIHHTRHHQAYVDNLIKAIAGTEAENISLEDILCSVSRYPLVIRNNAGGHYNHDLFWKTLSPQPQKAPGGRLAEAIENTFGSVGHVKEAIKTAALGQFGSGWAWLFVHYNGTLGITATANQDNPLMDTNNSNHGFPILGVDVWEHAYYLKYQNKRADYLEAFWQVLNWEAVEKNYEEALSKL